MTTRRRFLAGLLTGIPLAKAHAAWGQRAHRDILLISFTGMRLPREDELPPMLGQLVRSGIAFDHAFAASLTPQADEAVLRTGMFAHQIGTQLGIPSVWDMADAPPPLSLDERFRALGYSRHGYGELPSAASRSGPSGNLIAEVLIAHRPEQPIAATLARAEASVREHMTQRDQLKRSPPLVAIVAHGGVVPRSPLISRPIDLILSGPRGTKTVPNAELVSAVDILPTLLDWAGARPAAMALPGRSLLRSAQQSGTASQAQIYMSRDFAGFGQFAPIRAVRTPQYLIVRSLPQTGGIGHLLDGLEFYDVRRDPECAFNRVNDAACHGARARLVADLSRWQVATHDKWLAGA